MLLLLSFGLVRKSLNYVRKIESKVDRDQIPQASIEN